jgi:release factor glutamine methyltransferase
VNQLTWKSLYDEARARLGSDVDARRIVERASGFEGGEFHLGLSEQPRARAIPFFRDMVERRAAGEPLQYVVVQWGFRTLDLFVDRRVLIPRPETEQVVEVALAELRRMEPRQPIVVDLGTGSGAIALSIAAEVGDAQVWASDVSDDALVVARANLAGLGGRAAPRVRLEQGDWFAALPSTLRGRVVMIVSNPPYIAADEELPPEVEDWEPEWALRAGPTGLEEVARILGEAPQWLDRPGAVVLEIAPHQAEAAIELAKAAGFDESLVRPDLLDRPRALVARLGVQSDPL